MRQPQRGRALARATWFSICSRHYNFDQDCDLCKTGHWHNDFTHRVDQLVYRLAPKVWRWWVNRPRHKAKSLAFEAYTDPAMSSRK